MKRYGMWVKYNNDMDAGAIELLLKGSIKRERSNHLNKGTYLRPIRINSGYHGEDVLYNMTTVAVQFNAVKVPRIARKGLLKQIGRMR